MISPEPREDPLDFDRDVRPLLADRCFACHGLDAGSRESDLRLDTRAGATRDLGGYATVVPGAAKSSELWVRISSDSATTVMPPPKSHKAPLDAEEQEVLRRWIDDGAVWSRHWAFVPPIKQPLPAAGRHPIDAFVESALERRR